MVDSRKLKIIGGYHDGEEHELPIGCDHLDIREVDNDFNFYGENTTHTLVTHRYQTLTLCSGSKDLEILIPKGSNPFGMLIKLVRGYKQ